MKNNLSKIQFNGVGGWTIYIGCKYEDVLVKQWSPVMSNASAKIAFALLLALATPTASFAQAARTAGGAGSGNVPISGIAPGPANAGGLNNVMVDPSGIGNASRVAPLPPPRITVPVVPKFQ
jgi:hypothetical protein